MIKRLLALLLFCGILAAPVAAVAQVEGIRNKAIYDKGTEYALKSINAMNEYRYDEAIELGLRVLELMREAVGEEHADYGSALNNLGTFYQYKGDYATAVDYYEQAWAVRRKVLDEAHPHYAKALSNLAHAHFMIEHYAEALAYYRQFSDVIARTLGKGHIDYASSLNNIGTVYDAMGLKEEALTYMEPAAEIFKAALGEDSADYATVLGNIANTYGDLGRHEEALDCYKRALEIERKCFGEEHPSYAVTLINLGTTYGKLHNNEQSLDCFQRAAAILKERVGVDHPYYQNCLMGIGHVYSNLGKEEALEYYGQVLENRKKRYGEYHHQYAFVLNDICAYLVKNAIDEEDLPHTEKLIRLLQNAEKLLVITRRLISDYFSTSLEREREALLNSRYSKLLQIVTTAAAMYAAAGGEVSGSLLYDACLTSKGLLLNTSMEIDQLVRESGRQELRQTADQLRRVRQYMDDVETVTKEEVDQLRGYADSLERVLLGGVPALGEQLSNLQTGWQDIAARLGDDEVAVEFAAFYLGGPLPFYAAAVLRKGDSRPTPLMLYSCEEWLAAHGSNPDGGDAAELGRLIWGEIAKRLEPGDRVYFAPDGAFYQLGIEYLPIEGEVRMCDRYQMHRLSSTRELVLHKSSDRSSTAALYGGLDYNTDIEQMQYYASAAGERGGAGDRFASADELYGTMWPYLAGSRAEVEQIEPLLRSKAYEVQRFVGSAGVEERFKALSGAKTEIIHIATHGFYLPAEAADAGDEIRQVGGPQSEVQALTRSGLVFAGANNKQRIPDEIDDGILTAREISQLDLRGADLVVLSACQTGLGDVTEEGVFGLPRAFKKAGAQTLLMSLRPVSDEATQVMMTAFYRGLAAGRSKREAFLEAQREVKRHRFTEPDGEHSGDEPRYWAAFVMMD